MNQYIAQTVFNQDDIMHFGVKGMRWGVRRALQRISGNTNRVTADTRLIPGAKDTKVTKRVKNDYNTLTDRQFFGKYQASKRTYAKRVAKWGDPYRYAKKNNKKRIARAAATGALIGLGGAHLLYRHAAKQAAAAATVRQMKRYKDTAQYVLNRSF